MGYSSAVPGARARTQSSLSTTSVGTDSSLALRITMGTTTVRSANSVASAWWNSGTRSSSRALDDGPVQAEHSVPHRTSRPYTRRPGSTPASGSVGHSSRVISSDEYFREPGLTLDCCAGAPPRRHHPPAGADAGRRARSFRALKGSLLRQEVFADDAEGPLAHAAQVRRARTPYTVTEQNFTIRVLQHRGLNRYAVSSRMRARRSPANTSAIREIRASSRHSRWKSMTLATRSRRPPSAMVAALRRCRRNGIATSRRRHC